MTLRRLLRCSFSSSLWLLFLLVPTSATCSNDTLLDQLAQLTLVVHENGNGEPCGVAQLHDDVWKEILQTHYSPDDCALDKYQFESFLTYVLVQHGTDTCGGGDLRHYCDPGPARTVVQLDHQQLVRVPAGDTLPCRFYTRTGERLTNLHQLVGMAASNNNDCNTADTDNNSDQVCYDHGVSLYASPAGRVFQFAPTHVGEVFELTHVQGHQGEPISLTVLSLEPRVLDITNFVSAHEATALQQKALRETSETHKLHRSTTGTAGSAVFAKRTSENAWDTHGTLAQTIKRRGFQVLGLDEYHEAQSDGLQILRYNLTKAYIPHMDYLEDKTGDLAYDYDSAGKGGNRFATILLYMSDLPPGGGGETVFVQAWPSDGTRVDEATAIRQLRESGQADALSKGSWEERMAAQCRTRLAVQPKLARAVLFYSQLPDGTEDKLSLHGGCPVLNGTKWAANLWVWNAPRPEFQGAPLKKPLDDDSTLIANEESPYKKVIATFENSGDDPRLDQAQLFFEESFFADLSKGESVRVNTFESHVWHIVTRDGETLHTMTITGERDTESFVV